MRASGAPDGASLKVALRMPSSDEDLLSRIANRDQDAFLVFFDLYSPRVFGLLRKVVGDTTEAEDVVQDVMWEVWQKAPNYDPALGSPSTWVLMMARARGIDRVRKLQRDRARIEVLRRAAPDEAVEAPPDLPDHDAVRGVFDQLLPERRTALSLAFYSGLTRDQIAEATGVPVGTVKTRIRAGVQQLRESLQVPAGARS